MTKNTAILFVALFVAFTAALGFTASQSHASAVSPGTPTVCMESDACWNWAKQGNQQRSVVTLDGNVYIVGACEFNKMWAHGAIRYHQHVNGKTYETLDKMRGDSFARSLTDCPWRIRQSHPFPWHQSVGRWYVQQGY